MNKSTWVMVAVVALLLALWGFTVLTRPSGSAAVGAAQATPSTPAADPRDREIAELKERLGRVEASQRTAKEAAATRDPAAQAKPEGEARDPEVLKREHEIASWMEAHYTPEVQANVFGMYFADVDRLRAAEKPDDDWDHSIEQGLHKLLADGKASIGASTIERLECGSTLCRIRVNVANPNERGRLVHVMQQSLHLEEASVLIPAEGAFLEGYFARAGSSLPQFDQIKYVGAEMDRLGSGDKQ
jgi:hypothetical protein